MTAREHRKLSVLVLHRLFSSVSNHSLLRVHINPTGRCGNGVVLLAFQDWLLLYPVRQTSLLDFRLSQYAMPAEATPIPQVTSTFAPQVAPTPHYTVDAHPDPNAIHILITGLGVRASAHCSSADKD